MTAHLPFYSQILEPINKLLDTVDFDAVFYSLDWHPSDHVSFIDNVKMRAMDEASAVGTNTFIQIMMVISPWEKIIVARKNAIVMSRLLNTRYSI